MKSSVHSISYSFTGCKSLLNNRLDYTGECSERNSRKTIREILYRKSYEKIHSLRSLIHSQLGTKKSKASTSFRQDKRSSSTDGCIYPVTTEIAVSLQPAAMFDGHHFSSGTGSGVPAHAPEVCSGTSRCSSTVSFRARSKHAILSPAHPVYSLYARYTCDVVPVPVPDACSHTGKRLSARQPDAAGHGAPALPDRPSRAGHARSQLIPHVQRQLP